MSKTSLHPDKALEALHIYRGLRKYHIDSSEALREGLPMLWKESNGEKT